MQLQCLNELLLLLYLLLLLQSDSKCNIVCYSLITHIGDDLACDREECTRAFRLKQKKLVVELLFGEQDTLLANRSAA